MNKIVRKNKLYEVYDNSELSVSFNCTYDVECYSTKIYRVGWICNYAKKLIDKNSEYLNNCNLNIVGVMFTKGSTENTYETIDVKKVDKTDKRYFKLKEFQFTFSFNPPYANIYTIINIMDIVYEITKYADNFSGVIGDSDDKTNGYMMYPSQFSSVDPDGKYKRATIESVYSFINKNKLNLTGDFKKEYADLVRYENMSSEARNIFRSIGYDFTKHDIIIKDEDCKDYAIIYLSVPTTGKVTDREITTICNIYEKYIYNEYSDNNICFHINVDGIFIAYKDTPKWLVKKANTIFLANIENHTSLTTFKYREQYLNK